MHYLVQESDLTWKHPLRVLYFYAAWMPFHQKMTLMLAKLEQKYPNVPFFAIDTDYFKGLIKRFDVVSIPTVIVFRKYQETQRITGVLRTSKFIEKLADI